MLISLIAAVDCNFLLGANGKLPWGRIPADMSHFKRVTMGKPVIMGRKTFESIGRPLSGRKNIVLTSDTSYHPPGVHIAYSYNEACKIAFDTPDIKEIMVAGGASVYKLFLPSSDRLYFDDRLYFANRLYLTFIGSYFEGDTYFPIDAEALMRDWDEKKDERIYWPSDGKSKYELTFGLFRRKQTHTLH